MALVHLFGLKKVFLRVIGHQTEIMTVGQQTFHQTSNAELYINRKSALNCYCNC